MARAQVVSRNEAAAKLETIIHHLRSGELPLGDSKVDVPEELLLDTKVRRGSHEGIEIRLSWDVFAMNDQEGLTNVNGTEFPYEI